MNGIQEAVSSILSSSTRNLKGLRRDAESFFCAPDMARITWGASPLGAVVSGTRSQRQGRRREARSEGSRRQKSDVTNRNRIQGLCGAGKGAMDSDARYSLGRCGVNPAWTGGMRRVLLREVCREVLKKKTGQGQQRCCPKSRQKSAEVVVVPPLSMKDRISRIGSRIEVS